jgi:hypothetical protein
LVLEFQESQQVDYRLWRFDRRCLPMRPISLGCSHLRRYHRSMSPLTPPPRLKPMWRVVIEVAFIVFLFYSNLLMGEFTGVNGEGKTFAFALHDIVTPTNFAIALVSALIGYVVFEYLRHKL